MWQALQHRNGAWARTGQGSKGGAELAREMEAAAAVRWRTRRVQRQERHLGGGLGGAAGAQALRWFLVAPKEPGKARGMGVAQPHSPFLLANTLMLHFSCI